ncbi:MAG: type VI secretion system baseplate subunit TssF [Planctomycetes bacterium]|nr:type VI secretion system baseplate subunit TssF [Planctomycetota bacterium]MCL4729877.1 type VI secretion system baseplate subunit TssF [Planctomycetota bacterium]
MFNKYYQDELLYLRESGREFAEANPEAARFLAQPGADPDVERMLEGVAFLTARLRQKLDDELPELTHSFTEMFWPHYLRPVPATAIMQFTALPAAAGEVRPIPAGVRTDSVPVDGTRCPFVTCYPVTLLPLELKTADLRREAPPKLTLTFELPGKLPLDKLDIPAIRLHLAGEPAVTRPLFLALNRFVRRVTVRDGADPARAFSPAPDCIRPVGFGEAESVLRGPGASFPGFRLLQEYFVCPQKFMFVDMGGLEPLRNFAGSRAFTIELEFSRLPENMPPVSRANLLLHCTPAVNLFAHDADPVRLDRTRTEYTLRPAGENPGHFEIHSVDRVSGLVVGTSEIREFRPQFRLPRSGARGQVYYQVRRHPPVTGGNQVLTISFVEPPTDAPNIETASIELTCTNGALPARLEPGDIATATQSSPLFASCRNIGRPTATVPAPLKDDLLWRLVAHLSLNYMSLLSVDALRSLVGLYNFRANFDRQAEQSHNRLIEGIRAVAGRPATRLMEGLPVRGLEVELVLDEDLLGGEGEVFLFGSVLDAFFAQYVSLNSFSRLQVRGAKLAEVYAWPARIGLQAIL